jgi:hypothetical protein
MPPSNGPFHTCALPVGVRIRTPYGREGRVGGLGNVGHWMDPSSGLVGITTDDRECVIVADVGLRILPGPCWEA